jgi:hemolysin III
MTIGILLESPRRLVHHVRTTPHRFQSRREETANAVTHGLGFFVSLVAGPLLVMKAMQCSDWVMIAACIAYVIPLAGVYLCSMVSHAVAEPKRKLAWERWDQAMIYLLITGAYSPYAAAYLRSDSWPLLTLAMWILGSAGFLTKIFFHHRMRKAIIWMYMAIGWLPTISLHVMLPQMQPECIWWTVGGGLCFTFGALFLTYDRAAPFLHVLWHLAVLAGTGLHFAAIWEYVVMSA